MIAIAELFAAVYASPDDDATKLVLADALLAIGDPRGELIQLQVSGHDDSAARRLLQRHGMTWLGALRGKVIPLGYEKGFLASCLVVEPDLTAPEWATVHTVQLQEVSHLAVLDAMPSLRRVIHVDDEELVDRLVAHPRAGVLELVGATRAGVLAHAYAALDGLGALRAAEAPGFRLARGADGRLSQLDAVWSRHLGGWIARLPPSAIATATITAVPRSRREALEGALMHFTGLAATVVPMTPEDDRWWEATHERDERMDLDGDG